VFGIATVDGVAGERGAIAEVLAALAAEWAGAIDSTKPGDAAARSECDAFDSLPQLCDAADVLVAGCDSGIRRRQFSCGDVQVGAADAAGFHSEQDFAGARLGHG